MSENVCKEIQIPAAAAAERKRKQPASEKENPNGKLRKLDTSHVFGETAVSFVIDDDNDIWFKGVDLARALEMEDPNATVSHSMDSKFCKSYETLRANNTRKLEVLPNIHPKTTFVNQTGMNIFVLKSRKPRAEAFMEWVYENILPCSIAAAAAAASAKGSSSSAAEVPDPLPPPPPPRSSLPSSPGHRDDHPYRELNTFLKVQLEESKLEAREWKSKFETVEMKLDEETREWKSKLETLEVKLDEETREWKSELKRSRNESTAIRSELIAAMHKLFAMQPTCSPALKNPLKTEYLVLLKSDDPDAEYPYYCVRRQRQSVGDAVDRLQDRYPHTLSKMETPNSVNFGNYLFERLPNLKRTKNNEFRLERPYDEEQMLRDVGNIYRNVYGVECCR